MTTLTTADLTHIREQTGDACDPYEVSDEYIQWLHDNRANLTPLCMSSDPLGGTITWVLRTRVRKATSLFNEDGDGGTRSVSQQYTQLKEQLAEAEKECGWGGSTITISTLDTGMDADCDDSEYTLSRWYASWWNGL
jgi:hypothetical protein